MDHKKAIGFFKILLFQLDYIIINYILIEMKGGDTMKMLFPVLIVALFTGAGISAAILKQWNTAIYSFCAALLNVSVYFKPF